MDFQTPEGESRRGQSYQNSSEDFGTGFIRVYENDGTNAPRYIQVNTQNEILFHLLKLPNGREVEVYGFIDPETWEMFLDDAVINPETPIHEYTHIFCIHNSL